MLVPMRMEVQTGMTEKDYGVHIDPKHLKWKLALLQKFQYRPLQMPYVVRNQRTHRRPLGYWILYYGSMLQNSE